MLKCYISQIQIRKNIKSTAKLQERSHNSQHKDIGKLREGGENLMELIGNLPIEKGSL
jgi:hypothetical protein